MCRPNDNNNAANATTSKDPSDVRKASPGPAPSSSSNDRHDDHYYPRHFYFTKEKHSRSSSHIRPLNDKVESISSRKMKEASSSSSSSSSSSVTVVPPPRTPPHVLLHADGALVYPDRYRFLPLAYVLASIVLICRCPSPVALLLGIVVLYFESDLYSGVVHIVLDDPKNLGRSNYVMEAIMFQGCLEFQWHHEIPRDIAIKGLLSSCADLNVLVGANMIAVAIVHGAPWWRGDADNRLLWSIMGLKLLYGYFGQYNHLMAHESESRRPAVVRALQDGWPGVMLDRKKHNGHHRTYVDNYCLLGKMDWAIRLIDEYVVPRVEWRHNVWFGIWMSMSVFCLPCVVTPYVKAAAGWVGASMISG